MNGRRWIALIAIASLGETSPGWGAFTSKGSVRISASATASGIQSLTIEPITLPETAVFGKNAVIPVQIISNSGPINPKNLTVSVVYQLRDPSGGSPLGPSALEPIAFTPDPINSHVLQGNAVIPAADIVGIQNGGQLTYLFQALQGGAGTIRNNTGQAPAPPNIALAPDLGIYAPFKTIITDHFCGPVGPTGARVSAPDLAVHDGKTTVSFAPGAISTQGTLCIKTEDTTAWPLGPGGSKPATVYTITLQDTTLVSPAELVLSYPSDSSGKVLGLGSDPGSLGIYWLDQTNAAFASGNWRSLSRASLDTTLHTLTGMTGHFSTFALFAAGPVGSVDLRPSERIITPNGDGINDTAIFGMGIDEVKIFDVRGRRVRTVPGPSPVWDGTDDDGRIVESGVYLYQYSSLGERTSGVIAVAK